MLEHKLLVVDDDELFHQILKEIGSHSGYAVEAAKSLQHLQISYMEFKPTLVFLDLNLEDSDGIEVIRYLADLECKVPIYIMSGFEEKVLLTAMHLGREKGLKIENIVRKPIGLEEVRAILEKHQNKNDAINLENLKDAVLNNELYLAFQPKADVKTKAIVGAEVLVRWKRPGVGLVYPNDFIPLAEQTGYIKILSQHIIEKAMQMIHEAELPIQFSINLSAYDFFDLHLPDEIDKIRSQFNVDPTLICFEITESALITHYKMVMDILTRLRVKGYAISLDDFGTGYSSLVELHRLPFTELKIDRSFVKNLVDDPDALVIVRSIINLGHNLGLKVTAEGLESQEAWNILDGLGCDFVQGYFLGKPMDVVQLKTFIASHPSLKETPK